LLLKFFAEDGLSDLGGAFPRQGALTFGGQRTWVVISERADQRGAKRRASVSLVTLINHSLIKLYLKKRMQKDVSY
jgi:hypothetical protein